jgi:hypothetical protein
MPVTYASVNEYEYDVPVLNYCRYPVFCFVYMVLMKKGSRRNYSTFEGAQA